MSLTSLIVSFSFSSFFHVSYKLLSEALLDHSSTATHIGLLQALIRLNLESHSVPAKGYNDFFN